MGLLSPESLRYAGVALIYGCLRLGVAQLLRLCHFHSIDGVGVLESILKYLSLLLSYSAVLNVIIFIAFQVECGMRMIGKVKSTGRIPIYSQIVCICSISIAYTGYYICIFEFQERCVSYANYAGMVDWWMSGK